jgi:hypothetical protein
LSNSQVIFLSSLRVDVRVVSHTSRNFQRIRGWPLGSRAGPERGDHHVGVEPASVSLGPATAAPASLAKMMQVERSVKSALRRHLLRADQGAGPGRGDAEPMREYRRSVG